MEQVHRVDDQRTVRCIFFSGVVELLDRNDRVCEKDILPSLELGCGPVAIDPLYGRHAIFGNFVEQIFDNACLGVIRIYEYRQFFLAFDRE